MNRKKIVLKVLLYVMVLHIFIFILYVGKIFPIVYNLIIYIIPGYTVGKWIANFINYCINKIDKMEED